VTCVILQDNLESAEDQTHVVEHPSRSGEDISGHGSGSTEDPLGSPENLSTQVSPRWQTRKSHYVAPPPVSTNLESRPIIR
jgi:hypothetical protein